MKDENVNRLSKILAAAGVASRRACETLIQDGAVTVNGKIILKPEEHFNPKKVSIRVNGKEIRTEKKVCYLLNKPKGYICTNVRPGKQRILLDLFPNEPNRIYSVGRLDKDTEGLLLMTNDGHFADKVIHPRSNIEKEYLLKAHCEITHEHLVMLSQGMYIEGRFVKPAKVKKIRKNTLSITVKEGKKHEVRLLAEKASLRVLSLKRIRIGNILLGSLKTGSYRTLSDKEKKLLVGN